MKLLSAVAATGDSSVVSPKGPWRGDYRSVQVSIVGTSATVILRGRSTPNAPWVDLQTFTASGMVAVVLPPQIKFSVTAISSATVDAWADTQ